MKRACAYLRCSTDDQIGSISAQREQIENYARTNEYEVLDWFEDEGVSGTKMDRKGLTRLISAAESNVRWDFILAWDYSRIARPEDPMSAMVLLYKLKMAGKKVVFLHGIKLTGNTTTDIFLEAFQFGQAGEESIRKGRDVLRGQRQAVQHRSCSTGKPPYGYDALYLLNDKPVRRVRFLPDRSTQVLSIDGSEILDTRMQGDRIGKSKAERLTYVPGAPNEIRTVERIFSEFAKGLSTRTIARDLNRDGIPSPLGKTWGRTTIRRILENPAYKGTLAWNRRSCGKFYRVRGDGSIERHSNPRGNLTHNPEDQWVVLPDTWTGLTESENWELAKARLSLRKPASLSGKGAASPYLASGLLTCACGFRYTGSGYPDKRSPSRRYEYYRCVGRSEKGCEVCSNKVIPRQLVDDYLERRVWELYLEPGAIEALLLEVEQQIDSALLELKDSNSLPEDRKSLQVTEQKIERIIKALSNGVLEDDEAALQLKPLRVERDRLRASMSEARIPRKEADLATLRRKILDRCREQLSVENKIWTQASMEQRKIVVRAHVAGIVADQEKSTLSTTFLPYVASVGLYGTMS